MILIFHFSPTLTIYPARPIRLRESTEAVHGLFLAESIRWKPAEPRRFHTDFVVTSVPEVSNFLYSDRTSFSTKPVSFTVSFWRRTSVFSRYVKCLKLLLLLLYSHVNSFKKTQTLWKYATLTRIFTYQPCPVLFLRTAPYFPIGGGAGDTTCSNPTMRC